MATGMKYWLLAVGAGFGVVASLLLPVKPPVTIVPRSLDPSVLPEAIRYEELRDQVQLQREIVARIDWLESSIAELREASVEGKPSLIVRLSSPLPEDQVNTSDTAFTRQERTLTTRWESLLSERASIDLGVFHRRIEGAPMEPRWNGFPLQYFVGESNGRGFCVQNHVSNSRSWAMNEIGICTFVLRYGLPGPLVSEWLKAGSFERGAMSGERLRRNRDKDLVSARSLDEFGYRVQYAMYGAIDGWSFPLGVTRCLSGEAVACTAYFLDPGDGTDVDVARQLSEAVPELWVAGRVEKSWYEELILSDLETEFGAERFSRFWTSQLGVERAFQDAFGISAGEWMSQWFEKYTPRAVHMRRAGFGHGIQTILVILAALGIGVLRERKRTLA